MELKEFKEIIESLLENNLNSFSNTTIDNAVIGNVYGGGEEANVTGTTTVDIVNSSTVDNVFGGGKGTTATLGGLITVGITNSSVRFLPSASIVS